MCFSLQADLVAGAAVTAVGVAALASRPQRRDLPLAALPLVLGAHLLVEATIWAGLQGGRWAEHVAGATVLYLVVAFVVVPALVPVAVVASEPDGERRRLLPFAILGVGAAGALAMTLASGPVTSRISGHHIGYVLPQEPAAAVVVAYVVGTCGPAVLSRRPELRLFGWANLVVVLALGALQETALISLWCAWAAITSVFVLQHVRRRTRPAAVSPRVAVPSLSRPA